MTFLFKMSVVCPQPLDVRLLKAVAHRGVSGEQRLCFTYLFPELAPLLLCAFQIDPIWELPGGCWVLISTIRKSRNKARWENAEPLVPLEQRVQPASLADKDTPAIRNLSLGRCEQETVGAPFIYSAGTASERTRDRNLTLFPSPSLELTSTPRLWLTPG